MNGHFDPCWLLVNPFTILGRVHLYWDALVLSMMPYPYLAAYLTVLDIMIIKTGD